MKTKAIGPFLVTELTVDKGLDLMSTARLDGPEAVQKELVLRCVTKDGTPVSELSFSEFMPFMRELVDAAFEINGFGQSEKADE